MKRKAGVFSYIGAIFFMLFFLLPVFYIIFSSFKEPNDLFSATPTFFPRTFTFQNFVNAFERGDFLTYIKNSFIVAISSTALAVVINTMAGYALSKFRFKGDKFIMILILSTIMLPLEVIMVPIFSVLKFFGLYNSLLALIIPAAATPTGIFLMRQYLVTVPNDLMESARIDGASEWKIFTRIIVPNVMPAIATLAIFSFMWRWNDYIWPLIAISDPDKYTLQLAIANMTGQFGSDYSSIISTSVISMVPMVIVFLVFQRKFVQGNAQNGMKG